MLVHCVYSRLFSQARGHSSTISTYPGTQKKAWWAYLLVALHPEALYLARTTSSGCVLWAIFANKTRGSLPLGGGLLMDFTSSPSTRSEAVKLVYFH